MQVVSLEQVRQLAEQLEQVVLEARKKEGAQVVQEVELVQVVQLEWIVLQAIQFPKLRYDPERQDVA